MMMMITIMVMKVARRRSFMTMTAVKEYHSRRFWKYMMRLFGTDRKQENTIDVDLNFPRRLFQWIKKYVLDH